MRHRKAGIKLNRTPSHRKAMFRNMVTSLLKYERIRTTGAKAKELRRWADHIITLAKRGDLHARRQALAIVREKDVVHKLFETATERFGAVSGGYTRIVKLGRRPGDAAPMSLVELVVLQTPKKKKTKKKKLKADAAPGKATADTKTVKKEEKPEKAAETKTAPAKKVDEPAVEAVESAEKLVEEPAKEESAEAATDTKSPKKDAGGKSAGASKEDKSAVKAAPKKKAAAKKEIKGEEAKSVDQDQAVKEDK